MCGGYVAGAIEFLLATFELFAIKFEPLLHHVAVPFGELQTLLETSAAVQQNLDLLTGFFEPSLRVVHRVLDGRPRTYRGWRVRR